MILKSPIGRDEYLKDTLKNMGCEWFMIFINLDILEILVIKVNNQLGNWGCYKMILTN